MKKWSKESGKFVSLPEANPLWVVWILRKEAALEAHSNIEAICEIQQKNSFSFIIKSSLGLVGVLFYFFPLSPIIFDLFFFCWIKNYDEIN